MQKNCAVPESGCSDTDADDVASRLRAMTTAELRDLWAAMASNNAPDDLLALVTSEIYARELA